MKKLTLNFAFLLSFLAIASCTSSPTPNPHFKVGKPYAIKGITYYPKIYNNYEKTGRASWYGDQFHNALTSNGEVFDKNLLTAAHKTLPLPSIVKVTNLENNKSVVLRVNDRGPFVGDRIIDVSEYAAEKLGFHKQGTALVKIALLKDETVKSLKSVKIKPADKNLILAKLNGSAVAETTMQSLYPEKMIEKTIAETKQYYDVAEDVQPKIVNVASGTPRSMASKTPQMISGVSGAYSVQIASYRNQNEAEKKLAKLNNHQAMIEEAFVKGSTYYRVKVGSFSSKTEAQSTLASLRASGYRDAFVAKN